MPHSPDAALRDLDWTATSLSLGRRSNKRWACALKPPDKRTLGRAADGSNATSQRGIDERHAVDVDAVAGRGDDVIECEDFRFARRADEFKPDRVSPAECGGHVGLYARRDLTLDARPQPPRTGRSEHGTHERGASPERQVPG